MDTLIVLCYRAAITVVPLLPPPFGYWLFARFGDIAFLLGSKSRATYLKNIKHVLGAEADSQTLDRLARLAFQNLLKNYYDLFRGHKLSEKEIHSQVQEVTGFDSMVRELDKGKGLIGGSAHFGNFNLFLHLAAVYSKGRFEIVVPIERLEPPEVYKIVKEQRASQGIEIVPVDTGGRTLIKKLRAGALIGIAMDYDVLGTGMQVNFFGAPARLPEGGVVLALKYHAPLVVGFSRRLEDNRCSVCIEPPILLEDTGDLARDTRRGLEQVASILEKWIKQYPDQWLMFQPIWDEDKLERNASSSKTDVKLATSAAVQ